MGVGGHGAGDGAADGLTVLDQGGGERTVLRAAPEGGVCAEAACVERRGRFLCLPGWPGRAAGGASLPILEKNESDRRPDRLPTKFRGLLGAGEPSRERNRSIWVSISVSDL